MEVILRDNSPHAVVVPNGPQGGKGDPGGNVMAIGLFSAAPALTIPVGTDLVQTSGHGAVGTGQARYTYDAAVNAAWVTAHPRAGFVSANGRGFRLAEQMFSVRHFGAAGDAVISLTGNLGTITSTGTDDRAAIQAAIDYIDYLGGGTLYFPKGAYYTSGYISICKNLHILGAARKASVICTDITGTAGATAGETLRNGSVFYSNWDGASSNPIHVTIEHMGFLCPNTANVGAAYYDSNGTHWQIKNCFFNGFKYGVVIDYSELVDISECDFRIQSNAGAGAWIVNGPNLVGTHTLAVTNRISISKCQFNQLGTVSCILDEGGYTHDYISNNYNGGLYHIYAAGVQALNVIGGEFEASVQPSIKVTNLRLSDGGGVGGTCGHIQGTLNATQGVACIDIISLSGDLVITGNNFIVSGGGVPITGASNATPGLRLSGNTSNSTTGELVDGYNGWLSDSRINEAVKTNSALASFDMAKQYTKALVRCQNATGNTVNLKLDANVTGIPIGATSYLLQDAAGPITLVPEGGVTLTGPTATTAQNQIIVVRKKAANNWVSRLIVPNPLTQAITPASIAATGAIKTTTGGIGYTTGGGAGSTVTQATSKSTGVTLNRLCGQITMNAAALAAGTIVSFVLTDSNIAATDILILNHISGGTPGAYSLNARAAAGSATIDVRNNTGGSLSEAIVIGFALIKAANN